MIGRGRFATAGLLVALGLVLAGAVSAQVRPERGGPTAQPAAPVGVPTPKKPDLPVRGGLICAVAYEDRNANGRRDGGEGPLIGQSFTIANAAGAQLAQGASGGDGRFCTPRPLPFGDYRVRLLPGGGLTNTDPGGASLNAKSVALRTEGAVAVLFGSCRGASCAGGAGGPGGPARSGEGGQICAVAYDDRNGNGRRDAGEGPLPGQSFTIANAAGATLAQGATGGDGRFCTPRPLPFGDYRVRLLPGGGWTNTDPGAASLNVRSVALRTEGAVSVLFGNCRGEGCAANIGGEGRGRPGAATVTAKPPAAFLGRICVVAYDDRNGSGRRDAGEGRLPGQIFTIANSAGAPVAQGPTGAGGIFCNPRPLSPGDYWVHPVMGGGWTNSDPGRAGGFARRVHLPANQSVSVLFGNRREAAKQPGGPAPGPARGQGARSSGTICVEKYNDVNNNQVQDQGELPLAGWHFTVIDSNNTTLDQGTTDAAGLWCSSTPLPPAINYRVFETLQTDWVNTYPGGSSFGNPLPILWAEVNANQTTTLKFGNRYVEPPPPTPTPPPVKICVEKFNDLNGDGVWQSNEPSLSGFGFIVDDNLGYPYFGYGWAGSIESTSPADKACSEFTNWGGSNTFDVTESWYLALVVPGQWTATTPGGETQSFTGQNGQTYTLRFGNRRNPSPDAGVICVRKYNDLNGDGQKQSGEPWVSGYAFTVKDSQGATVAAGVSDSKGEWCTPQILAPGSHTVSETVPPGYANTQPGGNATLTVIVTPGKTLNRVFGNVALGKVCVTKYNDLNGDGQRQSGEPGLTGWTFNVRNINGVTVTTLTSTSGYPACSPFILPPGNYTIEEVLLGTGWKNTDPGGGAIAPFTVVPGGTFNAVFGNVQLGRICVRKYNDINGNGAWYGGGGGLEPFMTGIPFEVKDSSGQVVHTGLTAALGVYCTPSTLMPGVYTITETVPGGWTNTQPGGAASVTVTIPAPAGTPPQIWFGNQKNPQPGELCVDKYNDLNGDGDQDPGEGPLQGWGFTRSGGGMPSLSGSTSPDGRWCPGTELPPGTYTVTETMQSGWTNTDPVGPPVKTALVVTNQTTIVKFGNQADVPAAPNLTMVKTKLTAGVCHGSSPGANNCTFRFTITNIGGTAYTGPLSISDTVTLGGGALAVSVVTPPPGWNCSTGVQTPITCSIGSVNIPANATVTYDLQLYLNAAMPSQNNCAVLTWGSQQTGPACVQIFP